MAADGQRFALQRRWVAQRFPARSADRKWHAEGDHHGGSPLETLEKTHAGYPGKEINHYILYGNPGEPSETGGVSICRGWGHRRWLTWRWSDPALNKPFHIWPQITSYWAGKRLVVYYECFVPACNFPLRSCSCLIPFAYLCVHLLFVLFLSMGYCSCHKEYNTLFASWFECYSFLVLAWLWYPTRFTTRFAFFSLCHRCDICSYTFLVGVHTHQSSGNRS